MLWLRKIAVLCGVVDHNCECVVICFALFVIYERVVSESGLSWGWLLQLILDQDNVFS